MKEINLKEVIDSAEKIGKYFITVTTREVGVPKDKLSHFVLRKEFAIEDMVPSLDHSLRSMNIVHPGAVKIETPSVALDPLLEKETKPLKIAIITHFNRAPENYSPARAVRNQIKMLQQYCHTVVFFTQEGSELDWGCETRHVVPKFKREKNIVNEEAKNRFIDVLRRELTDDFDLAITHDLYIDDCITYREAIRECGVDIKWLHWARSGVGVPIDFSMKNSRYVYMNHADAEIFANRINAPLDKIRVVFNEKDPNVLFSWDPITKMIVDKMRLWEKDIIQVYPLCTTRMMAKGIDSVIWTFAALKALGNKVCLIVANANGRKIPEEIEKKINMAKECGLDDTDIVFTSTLANEEFKIENEVPHRVVNQLMQISNLFVFPSKAEVCSNVLLEASINKNLIVLNSDLPSQFDFVDTSAVLSHPFTSFQSVHYDGREQADYDRLAKEINGQIKSNKTDKNFRHVWRNNNFRAVYEKQLRPVIYE